jgi:hypothetical protein
MMQEASKRRCNKIKLISLSFVSKLISQKILIKNNPPMITLRTEQEVRKLKQEVRQI